MISRPHELFQDAFANKYAIGAFNCSNLEFAQAIMSGAAAQRAPVILQTSEGALAYANAKMFVVMAEVLASEAGIPVIVHLDHGKSLETVKACIEAGYTSVMCDFSTKPLVENIRLTQEVVAYAHARGVWVEAELGAILGTEGALQLQGQRAPEALFTDPAQAAQFVASTQIDALAVSVGTIHGAFTGQEYIRFELLQAIARELPTTPLVIHGASGIANEHLQQVATHNVCKINVDTELRIAFNKAVQAYYAESHTKIDPRDMLGPAREAVQLVIEEKIKLFGAAGQAR